MSDDNQDTHALLVELTREVRGARADISLVSNDLGIVKDRLVIIENWKNDSESRAARTSMRVEQGSKVDLEQAAALAAEKVAREELASKVDTLLAIGTKLEKLTNNPMLKVLVGMLLTAAVSWLASKGLAVK